MKSQNKAAEIGFEITTTPKEEIIITRGITRRGSSTMDKTEVRASILA